MKTDVINMAKANGADIVRFASADRFPADSAVFKIMPETRTVIGMAFRVLRGIYRGIEEGSTYYQYSTMAVENMEETIMPMSLLRVSGVIEERGFTALPQKKNQLIMEDDGTNPEVLYSAVYRNKSREIQLDFLDTAVRCGLGEKGLQGALLTDEFGPMVRYCFILTDAEIESDEEFIPHLCDKCGKCIKACPGKAVDESGNTDSWQCAVYYSGANGTRNPFMPPDAFRDMENRAEIIAGEAKVSPEKAREILDKLDFYPSIGHSYAGSICGRVCDVECYVHLEEKGVLTRKFKTPFRKREPWKFDLKDFV